MKRAKSTSKARETVLYPWSVHPQGRAKTTSKGDCSLSLVSVTTGTMGNCECSREEEIGQEKISFRLIIDDGSSIDNFTKEIEVESTIGDLKRRVATKCGVSKEFHHLVKLHFEGQVLREEMVISHCPQLHPVR